MSLSPNEKYPGATEADPNYKDSKFKDNNPSTTNNGSPLKALDRNEQLALQEAMMNAAGFDYNGFVDTPQNSQLFQAYKASLGNGANLLSNHNFLIQSPDDSQPAPSATPTSYPPGFQIFSGVFANETTGITNLTYIDGRVLFSGGDFYMVVPNTGGLERLTADQFVASVADFDGKPRTRGVSFALVGDEYRVTVGVDALEDSGSVLTPLGSVKFEQGSVATGHEVQYGVVATGSTTPRTLEDRFADVVNVKDFGAVGDGVTDDTDAIQAAIGVGGKILFGRGETYLISALRIENDNVNIDLNGSTLLSDGSVSIQPPITWTEARAQILIYAGDNRGDGTDAIRNFSIGNGVIQANNAGVALGIKYVNTFRVHDLQINRSQASGIDIQGGRLGTVERCELIDCACDPAYAWDNFDHLESFSDGMNIWTGAYDITVQNTFVNNTRWVDATHSTSRCGIVLEGYGTGGRVTEAIKIESCSVQGYDRAFHTELAGNSMITNCKFTTEIGAGRYLYAPVVVWSQAANVVFKACAIAGDGMMYMESANNVSFEDCTLSNIGTKTWFRNSQDVLNKLSFTRCNINYGSSEVYWHHGIYTFKECDFTSAGQTVEYAIGDYTFNDCNFIDAQINAINGDTSTYFVGNCHFRNFGEDLAISAGEGKGVWNLHNLTSEEGTRFFIDADLKVTGSPSYYNREFGIERFTGPYRYNGHFYATAYPTTGVFKRGDICYNTTPNVGFGSHVGWVCTIAGTDEGATWGQFGEIVSA